MQLDMKLNFNEPEIEQYIWVTSANVLINEWPLRFFLFYALIPG